MRLLLAALTFLLVSTPAAARDWWRAETNNFIIMSEDDEDEVRRFAAELERYDMALRFLQNMPVGEEQESPSTKLTVYRFGDIGDISRAAEIPGIAGVYFGRAGESIALTPARGERRRSMSVVNVDRSRNRAARLDEVAVLQHEYVHYFMLQHFPAAYPSWYVEGYAELLATMRFLDDGSFHVGEPPQYRAYNMFQMSQFDLEDMLDQDHDLTGREAFQFYGTGWLFTHYMFFDPARYAQLNEYLTAIGQGEDSLTAARRIFGDLDAINRELLRYRSSEFPGINVKPSGYVEPAVEMRELTPEEQEFIVEEIRLLRGVDKGDARAIASEIAPYVQANQDAVHPLILLGRAQLAADQLDGAQATAERIIELAPERIEGPLLASLVASERAKQDPAWAEQAGNYAAQAFAIDSRDPRAGIAYYYSFIAANMSAPEDAVIALEQVYDIAGSDVVYRVLMSRQLLLEDRPDDAKAVLLPVAFRGHNQGNDDEDEDDEDAPPSFDDVMALIDSGDSAGAAAALKEMLDWEAEED